MAHLRALLIATHLFAIIVVSLPSVGSGLNRQAWKNPTVQAEFKTWTGWLNQAGLNWSPAKVEDVAWDVAKGWADTHSSLTRPFQSYYRYCGTWQSWRMFVAPHRFPSELRIDIDRGDGFEPLYIPRSHTASWRRRQLEQDRMRSMVFRYGWKHIRRRGHYKRFHQWAARHAASDFPDALRFRTRLYTYATPTPEDTRAGKQPKGRFIAPLTTQLDKIR